MCYKKKHDAFDDKNFSSDDPDLHLDLDDIENEPPKASLTRYIRDMCK